METKEEHDVANSGQAVVLYSDSESRLLHERILAELRTMNDAANRAYPLLLEAKEHETWRALGFKSWEAYVHDGLQITRSHSYRLLDLARAERQLTEAVGEPVQVKEGTIRPLKAHLTSVGIQAKKLRKGGMGAQEAVDTAIEEARREVEPVRRERFNDGGFSGGAVDGFSDDALHFRCPRCGYEA